MNEIQMVDKIKKRILTKIPNEARAAVEVEIKRIENEVHLKDEISACSSCSLAANCTNKVPGIGSTDASVMFIGAAPGRQEDEQGTPFVGEGGEVLKKAIQAVGWNVDDLYLTNIVKCHPPGNRNPLVGEIATCFQHLKKEIEMVQPKVIVALGSTAANTLIHPDFKITQENGHWFEISEQSRGIAVYDPAYLLRLGEGTQRQVQAKWDVFNALKKVKEYQDAEFRDDFG